MTNFSMIAV